MILASATRRRGLVLAVLLSSAILSSATVARAAEFTLTPGQSAFSSGAGPFDWSFASGTGGVGYRLSSETRWHRCLLGSPHVELSGLPDGQYSIEIADDLNLDNLADSGLWYSSTNTCEDPSTAPPGAVSRDTIVIDSTPPTVGTPLVITAGTTAQASVQASDAGTGVASYSWVFGDGAQDNTSAPYDRHTYLLPGTYAGQVTVADGVGNRTTQPFSVTIAPATPPPLSGGSPAGSTQPHPTPPFLTVSAAHGYTALLIARRTGAHARVGVSCTRVNPQTLRCKLTWTARGYSYDASGRFWLSEGRDNTFHPSYDFRGTRTGIACAKHHRRHLDTCKRSFHWIGSGRS
jgi:hypothetical protein